MAKHDGRAEPIALHIRRQWDGAPADTYPGSLVSIQSTSFGLELVFRGPCMGDAPPTAPPGRLWGLWNHEVLECFIVGPKDEYLELEVGPHGHFLALRLRGARKVVDDDVPICCEWSTPAEGMWSVRVLVHEHELPPMPWRINAFAIFGAAPRTYLAATPVPGDRPDFHRIEHFPSSSLTCREHASSHRE